MKIRALASRSMLLVPVALLCFTGCSSSKATWSAGSMRALIPGLFNC